MTELPDTKTDANLHTSGPCCQCDEPEAKQQPDYIRHDVAESLERLIDAMAECNDNLAAVNCRRVGHIVPSTIVVEDSPFVWPGTYKVATVSVAIDMPEIGDGNDVEHAIDDIKRLVAIGTGREAIVRVYIHKGEYSTLRG
jgi:hypothetical protein